MNLTSENFTLKLIYLRQISAGMLIYQPIFIPFLLSRGLNYVDVGYLFTIYNLGVLVLDIPAGYVADHFGRKWALAGANTALATGTLLLALGQTMPAFILAELFYALAIALDMGVHSAYLYDFLREHQKEKEYYRYDALGTFLYLVAASTGTLAAGFIAEKNLVLPIWMTFFFTAIGIPAACMLPRLKEKHTAPPSATPAPEDKNGDATLPNEGLRGVLDLIKGLFVVPGLRWALGVTIVWFWARQYVALIISQPYFKAIGLDLGLFGVFYSMLTLFSGFIALLSRQLIQKPDLRHITMTGLTLIPLCFLFMGANHSKLGVLGYFLFCIPYGLTTAVTNTLLNRQFDHHHKRATFLSVVDFFVRAVSSVLVFSLGYLLQYQGAHAAMLAAGLFTGTLVLFLLPAALRYAVDPNIPQSGLDSNASAGSGGRR